MSEIQGAQGTSHQEPCLEGSVSTDLRRGRSEPSVGMKKGQRAWCGKQTDLPDSHGEAQRRTHWRQPRRNRGSLLEASGATWGQGWEPEVTRRLLQHHCESMGIPGNALGSYLWQLQ